MNTITRNEAISLLKKYNEDPFHIQHAYTVEAVMKWFQMMGFMYFLQASEASES